MGIVRGIPDIENWLDADAHSWSSLLDQEYKALVRRWSECFSPLITAGAACLGGSQAMLSLESRLPGDVYVFNGVQVPKLANMGGLRGPAAYRANGLRRVSRDFANQRELILVSEDFSWSCVFSHEAGAWVWEQLYELGANAPQGATPDSD